MSTSYWAILGYGIDLDLVELDPDKVIAMWKHFGHEIPDEDDFKTVFGEDIDEILDNICDDHKGELSYGDDGNGTYYLMIAPTYNWNYKDPSAPQTEEEAKDFIVQVLSKYIVDDMDLDVLRSRIDYISTYGCG